MKMAFVGLKPLTGWYGLDLHPGEEIEIPAHLVDKALNNPHMFAPLGDELPEPRRRGRPRKVAE